MARTGTPINGIATWVPSNKPVMNDFNGLISDVGTALQNKADYSSGSWTPTIYGGTTAGSPTFTSSGQYYRIGKLVYCNGSLSLTSRGGMTGGILIGGLPYPAYVISHSLIPRYSGLALTSGQIFAGFQVYTNILQPLVSSNTASSYLYDTQITDTLSFHNFSFIYRIS